MTNVVIVGGGFGGVTTARTLERILPASAARITLVTQENAMLFTPLLSLVAAGVLDARQALVPLRPQLSHTDLRLGSADAVDLRARTVQITSRAGGTDVLPFDRLVLAPGSVTRLPPDLPGVEREALGAKSLVEAAALHNHVLEQLELADAAEDLDERRRRLTFVAVGAGYAGTEMAAALQAMSVDALQHYPRLQPEDLRWLLLQHGKRILPELPEPLSARASMLLQQRGFDVRTETTVTEAGRGWVRLSNGDHVATETLIWSAGVAPHPWVADLGLPADERGRLLVNDHLEVSGCHGVYALGDAAAVTLPDLGRPAPPTADHAASQGRTCARNVAASLGWGTAGPHQGPAGGALVVNLGRHQAVAALGDLLLSGVPAWAITVLDRVARIPAGRRAGVTLRWAWYDGRCVDTADLGQIGALDAHAAAEPAQPGRRQRTRTVDADPSPIKLPAAANAAP
jgi:NADH dehydrogenase